MSGPNSSRTRWQRHAARLPPAESPPTATRLASTPSSSAFSTHQVRAARQSSRAAGARVLGREPVVDRHDDGAGAVGEGPRGGVGGVEVADHPAAAVEPQQERRVAADGVGGRVHADGDVVAVAGDERGRRRG